MASHLLALCWDANNPARLANFWAGLLGREVADDPHGVALPPDVDTGFWIRSSRRSSRTARTRCTST